MEKVFEVRGLEIVEVEEVVGVYYKMFFYNVLLIECRKWEGNYDFFKRRSGEDLLYFGCGGKGEINIGLVVKDRD